jgi:outer membrane protein TolC
MELLEAELRVLQESSNVRFAKNATLPLVDLSYQYNLNGLGTSLDDSLTMVREGDFEDHRLGITVEVPIGNEAARSRLRRALASRMQALASRQLRGQLIEQEVLDALDQLEANFQRIVAARQRVLLAARVMEAETRQFGVGLRTSTEVLDAQTRLANAQSDEISALTEYQIAQVDLAFATGMVLGRSGVVWEPIEAPKR